MAASLSVDTLQKLWYATFVKVHNRHYLEHTQWISLTFLGITSLLSFSRVGALYKNYHGSMDVWMHVNKLSYDDISGEFFFKKKFSFLLKKRAFVFLREIVIEKL